MREAGTARRGEGGRAGNIDREIHKDQETEEPAAFTGKLIPCQCCLTYGKLAG